MKKVELKRRAEAVATQRQELMIPLMQHRRFSETVAIDHRAKPKEMQVKIIAYRICSVVGMLYLHSLDVSTSL